MDVRENHISTRVKLPLPATHDGTNDETVFVNVQLGPEIAPQVGEFGTLVGVGDGTDVGGTLVGIGVALGVTPGGSVRIGLGGGVGVVPSHSQ